jgi:CheY-like chemotaxis protein
MDALIAYLKNGGSPQDPARKEWANLLKTQPDQAALAFLKAVVVTVESAPDAPGRTRQFLGYVERLFGYLLDDPQVGWQTIIQILPKFNDKLPESFRMLMPTSPTDLEAAKRFLPAFQSMSMDFKARVTAGSIRAGDMADRALASYVVELLGSPDEKKALLEMLRKELGEPTPAMKNRLDEIECRPVLRRQRISSLSFVAKIPTRQTRAVVPALVIEPNEETRFKFKSWVGPEGFMILEAGNGADALGILPQANPKMIIMEMVLTGITGIGLLFRLKQMTPPIPVIAKSATDEKLASAFEVKTYPSMVFLKNPVTEESVVQAVRAVRAKHNF